MVLCIYILWLFSTLYTTISRVDQVVEINHNYTEISSSLNSIDTHKWKPHYVSAEDYPEIYKRQPRNCSRFVPPEVWAAMEKAAADLEPKHGPKENSSKLLIPDDYLVGCVVSSLPEHARHWNAFAYATDSEVNFSLAVNELVAFDYEGAISLMVTAELEWRDPHLAWNRGYSRLPDWVWPEGTVLPALKLWTPQLTVLNCKACAPRCSVFTVQYE